MSGRRLDAPTINASKVGRRSYDWDRWCDGSWYEVVLAQDVAATTTDGFRNTLQLQATKRHLDFELRSDGTRVQFRFYKPEKTTPLRGGAAGSSPGS